MGKAAQARRYHCCCHIPLPFRESCPVETIFPMMSNIIHIIFTPVLLLISIPLLTFAFLTTTLAVSTLFIRVALVYAELGAVLLQNYISPRLPLSKHPSPIAQTIKSPSKPTLPRRSSRRSSTGSGQSNGGSATPKAPETSGLGIYSGQGATRDFEGVGGWRTGHEDEDGLWTNMNSRLELPVPGDERQRHHRRSFTGSSLNLGAIPLVVRSPARSRATTPVSRRDLSATWGEEAFFGAMTPSKSTTELDRSGANIGRVMLRQKPSSLFSSECSARSVGTKSPWT